MLQFNKLTVTKESAMGGNVFKQKTQRINLEDINPTIDWLESITSLELHSNIIGSVGKKSSSGDLDMVIDEKNKSVLIEKLNSWVTSNGFLLNEYLRKSGDNVHFLTPIKGDAKNGYVQTDFMISNDPIWIKFSMYSEGDGSKYSGADRNKFLSALAKCKGFKYSWKNGLSDRSTGEFITKNPDDISNLILGTNSNTLMSVETINDSLEHNEELTHLIILNDEIKPLLRFNN